MHEHKSYSYEHLRTLSRQILEIDKVTICAALSTGTSPTNKSTTPLNSRIFPPTGVEFRTWGATETLVIIRVHALSRGQRFLTLLLENVLLSTDWKRLILPILCNRDWKSKTLGRKYWVKGQVLKDIYSTGWIKIFPCRKPSRWAADPCSSWPSTWEPDAHQGVETPPP